MKRILIADASKASLVMTSEVFKDHFPGVQVVVARTSADALELAKTAGELDAFIIDYDLPDRDGAFTAARLKKMFSQPILITAFDRPDVHESIDRDLAAFDDCLSWLKKPVKPELVVSLAQRFIEGQHRCQRRVNCSLPAFLEVEFVVPAQHSGTVRGFDTVRTQQVARAKIVSKKTAKNQGKSGFAQKKPQSSNKTGAANKNGVKVPRSADKRALKAESTSSAVSRQQPKKDAVKKRVVTGQSTQGVKKPVKMANKEPAVKPLPAIKIDPIVKMIPITIDDVSLGGAKIRINNKDLMINHSVSTKGKSKTVQMCGDFKDGQILNIFVPPSAIIEAGVEALEKWQKAQSKLLLNPSFNLDAFSGGKTQLKSTKSSTLGSLVAQTRNATKRVEAEQKTEINTANQVNGNVFQGEVRWTASNETFSFCGLRSQAVNISKKLFESMIEIESRARSHLSPIVSPNIPRTSKLNA